jgi:hypothetical protein
VKKAPFTVDFGVAHLFAKFLSHTLPTSWPLQTQSVQPLCSADRRWLQSEQLILCCASNC